MGHNPVRWKPTDPKNGDFSFQNLQVDDFNPDDWPAVPSAYRPTTHFRSRYREYDRILDGKKVNSAICGGKLVPALNDCAAFYTKQPGVVFYILVGWDLERDNPREEEARVVVTGWPWVYDRDELLDTGRYSTRVVNRMMKLNGSLFNAETADHDWLKYYSIG